MISYVLHGHKDLRSTDSEQAGRRTMALPGRLTADHPIGCVRRSGRVPIEI